MLTRRPVLLALAASMLAPLVRAEEQSITGNWSGVLEVGSQRLRLKFEIAADGAVTLYSLDQGATPIPGKATSMAPESIAIEVTTVRGSFRGRLARTDRIEGTWRQGGNDLPLALSRGDAGLAAPANAAEPLTKEGIETLRREGNVPALAAASTAKGKAPARWVAGERASGSGVAATVEDQWHLGSITKSMTATLVARLIESGAIGWNDTVGDLLKGVVPDMHDAYKTVTFRHLLCHRAGLANNIPMEQFAKFPRESADIRADRRALARIALTTAPIGPQEATFSYANNGFIVAGTMLEAKLDKTWEELIQTHVFTPLRLTSAGFGAPGKKGELTQPTGHAFDGKSHMVMRVGEGVTDNPQVLGPAGTVHMSLADVLTYLGAHIDGPFLKPDSRRTLHTPPFGGEYAMGWVVRSTGELWHNGSNTLWYAEVLFNPATGLAAVACCERSKSQRGYCSG